MYNVSEIINCLVNAGLCIEFFNEFDYNFDTFSGEYEKVEKGFFRKPFLKDKLPLTYSLKTSVKK